MFTGIVAALGSVRKAKMRSGLLSLEIEAPSIARALDVGDSVAVDGVCLTAVDVSRKRFSAEAMRETLETTALERLRRGHEVNLEPAARFSDRIGGHIVQGHVDGTARVLRIEDEDGMRSVWFGADDDLMRYMIHKGSIAIDGISLTLADVGRTSFKVALIPHTLQTTTIKRRGIGDEVNVEVDMLAKYVERLTRYQKGHGNGS